MKKYLSYLFTISILLLTAVTPVSAVDGGCDCGFSPIVYVGPLGCARIVRDAGTDNEQQLWPIDSDFLMENLKSELPALKKGILTFNSDLIGHTLARFVNDCMSDLTLDEDGRSKANVTTPSINSPHGAKHGPDDNYYFNYDFRLDPYEHAERLHGFIDKVKQLTGHDSVKLMCSSMGGVVMSAYLDEYGYEGIDAIVCRCSPLKGTAVAGEGYCGKVELNGKAVTRYAEDGIPYLEKDPKNDDIREALLYALLDTLKATGVIDGICALGEGLIKRAGHIVFNEALIPIFRTFPGIWSFVPEEYFEEAVEFMGLKESGTLYDKVMKYRTAMANIETNLKAAQSNGTRIALIVGYNVQRTPLVTLWKSTSDGTVDTKYASLGATCGDVKKKLSRDYLKNLENKEYLSPDKMIDASTCAFPDYTWFIKDWLHCNGNSGIDSLVKHTMADEEPVNIHTYKEYPQFMEADENADTIYPATGGYSEFHRLISHPSFLNFTRFFYSIFKRIFFFI
ncbi:MAG: hypothetical protein K6B52_02130 [Clostridiales bacterium]|nr:hypothetical protein [Clostridiales bacterium]